MGIKITRLVGGRVFWGPKIVVSFGCPFKTTKPGVLKKRHSHVAYLSFHGASSIQTEDFVAGPGKGGADGSHISSLAIRIWNAKHQEHNAKHTKARKTNN